VRSSSCTCAALALWSLAGCHETITPSYFTVETVPIDVSVETAVLLSGPFPALTVAEAPDTVRVSWWIATGSPCYSFAATAAASADTLIATLIANQAPVGCMAGIPGFAYRLTISGLPPALGTLRLVHEFRNRSDTTQVTEAVRPLGL
jgi:hypothetical protein